MTSQAGTQIVRTVGRNIARARGELELSQRQLGAKMGMDSRGISRWENGHVMPSPARLAALAKALDRDVSWFYVDHDSEPVAA